MKRIFALIMTLSLLTTFVFAIGASAPSENSFPDGAIPVKVGVGSFDSENDAKNALDGNLNTYLKFVGPQAGTDKASEIHISFKGAWETLSGVRIYTKNANESVKKIKLRLLTSDSMTSLEVDDVTVTDSGKGYFDIPLNIAGKGYNVKAQAIRISPVELTGSDWSIAEVKWLAKDVSLATKALDGSVIENGKEAPEENITAPAENTVSFDNYEKIYTERTWKISATSERVTVRDAFDRNYKTFWHSNYTNEGSTITGKDQAPFFITVEFPEVIEISGWCYTPRNDSSSGTVQEYVIHGSADGNSFIKLYEGTFNFSSNASENKEQKAAWESKQLKAVKIEIKKGIGGYGTAAEIEFLKKSGEVKEEENETPASGNTSSTDGYIERSSWKLSVNSEVQKDMIKNIIDGKTGSYWHSSYKAENGVIISRDSVPFIIDVDFGKSETISGLKMIPRQDAITGTFTKVNLYASESENGELILIRENVEFNRDTGDKDVLFSSNIKARRIRIEVVASFNYGTLAELYVLGENKDFDIVSYEKFAENEKENALIKVPNTEITASYSGADFETYKVGALTDGNMKTVWQGIPDRGGDIPVVSFDLGGVKKIKEIAYTPFNHSEFFGCWLKVNIWASADGENFDIVKENVAIGKGTNATRFRFDEAVEARYFEFEILDYHDARPSGGEVEFFQRQIDSLSGELNEKYILKIGSNDIKYGENETTTIDVAPFIVNGTTLIPLRGLLELMGAEILWNGEIQEITVKNKDYEIKLMVDYRDVYVTTEALGKIRYTLREVPIIKDSRTFIPVRFVSEQLGYNVVWNGETQEITITK